jgi:hypothetical protein
MTNQILMDLKSIFHLVLWMIFACFVFLLSLIISETMKNEFKGGRDNLYMFGYVTDKNINMLIYIALINADKNVLHISI